MGYEIITDSSCNLSRSMIEELGVRIIPFNLIGNGMVHQSRPLDQDVDLGFFYTMMREGATFTTSLPSMLVAREILEAPLKENHDVLYIGFSSALSSAYDAIRLLLDSLSNEYPDRTIIAIDSLSASAGQGLLVWHAAHQRNEGRSLQEVHSWLEETKGKVAHWFTVDDLKYLMRGGRITAAEAYLGSILNVKPVMHVDENGRLVPVEKARGRKKSLRALASHMSRSALPYPENQTVFITHGDCQEDAEFIASEIRGLRDHEVEIVINFVEPVIGSHAGPGVVAIFFLAESRS
ncbi:MAG: DegV family protein [Eggerthellaceae bacterium]|nr:DegV family protein [Eggerthellaceae bacterium]